ncbi:Myosin-M heavy chain [Paramuricea clavata]|uniref:Myosin-M heavy chain, partial n=1 Tax=Paramuricea clavata TaxID=317549 RepID=A0A7D9HT70_PARCT|nr:Myosin-M heavy chain [Paramuricea clavata]
MQGTERFEVASFLGTWNDKKFFKVQCKESLEFFTMEVVSKQSFADPSWMQFGTVAESLPNWGLPFCMELRFVFETQHKLYYILDCGGEASLVDLMNDGLPEPTVLVIAAELGLALEGLHELGVSYNELDLGHVTVDNSGHVVLWREFEGKEYWHISECICGVLGGNCEKTEHKVKRRGTNVPPGQRHWEEIFRGVQDDWKILGVMLCQLLTGQLDFQNLQSLEEAIISLFITPNTKDFLYGLVSGALQSFEDLKCHPCFDGLDWDEVKSKCLPSPLMASFRSRLHTTPSRRLPNSPSLQNVYTAGISARQERGVFTKPSLSRTHSTSDLHSYSLGNARPSLSAFNRASSERRSTLAVPYSGQNRPDKERLGPRANDRIAKQDTRILGYSQHPRAKSALNLHRKVFEQNSRGFDDRPPCLSAPNSPRHSVDTAQSYAFFPHNSAPSFPQGSANTIHLGNGPILQPTTTDGVYNHPETNPFHEGYKKRWGSATIDTAYGIYSSHLKRTDDGNNNSTIPSNSGDMVDTNQLKNNSVCGSCSRDLQENAYGATSCYGSVVSSQPNTYAISNDIYSSVLRRNDDSTVPDKSGMIMNPSQRSACSTEITQQGSQTSHYSVDTGVYYNSRNSPNNTSTRQAYFQPNDSAISSVQEQSQETMGNVNTVNRSGNYVLNSQLSPGNIKSLERSYSLQKISDQQKQFQEHLPQHRRGSLNLGTTDGIESLRSQNPAIHVLLVNSNGSSQPTNTSSLANNEQFQKRNGSITLETSDGIYSSFFQIPSNNQNFSTEQNTSKETANILFQKYFRSRRDSVDSENSGKVSPIPRNTEVNLTRSFVDESSQAPQRQAFNTFREQSYVRKSNHEIPATISRNSPVSRVSNNVLPSEQLSNEYTEANYGQSLVKPGGIENYSGLRTVSNDELRNNFNQSTQLWETTDNASPKRVLERTVSSNSGAIYSSSLQTTPNNLASPNTSFQKRNSRSPEPLVAIHPSVNPPYNPTPNSGEMSAILSSDADEFNHFQEESQRRRSSTDVGSVPSLPISTNKAGAPSPKMSLSRSVSYSNVREGFRNARNDRTNAGQISPRRSTTLKPIPSFEEFRTMRALSKMAYGERHDSEASPKDASNGCRESSRDKNDYYSERGYSTGNDNNNNNSSNNNNNNNNNNSSSHNNAETTTKSPTNNPVIQDLLVKYGLDKSPRTSTLKLCQNSSNRADSGESNSAPPPHDNLKTTTSDPTDTKQRLLNILDDFLAVRTKQKTLSTSSSMYNLKASNSLRDQRRPSLPTGAIEENRSNYPNDCSVVENKGLELKVRRDSPSEKRSPICKQSKPEKPTLIVSSPNSEDINESRDDKDTITSNQSKAQDVSKGIEKKNCFERSTRRSRKTNRGQKDIPEVQQSRNRATSPNELKAKSCAEKSNTGINQSDESMVSLTSEVKPREREGSRRVSEKARNMARQHRESLELVKNSGKKARKERRKSFTQALQNKTKESTSEKDEYGGHENGTNDTQPVGKSGPMKGDHSFEIESASVEQRDVKYRRLMNRRTSSLLSLTDDLSGDLDEFDGEDMFPNRSESLSEFNEDHDQAISRRDSFLSVDTDFPRGRHASRTESSSSLLSRGSSFHSNFSADSGSVQLDFEDSDEDDDLFYLTEPLETAQKSETEIQRNDSGLGDEIGVGTRAKKRWQDLGHVSSRQSTIISSWREMAARKEEEIQEGQGEDVDKQGLENESGQKPARKVSRDRRISRERQPNAIDCPDCGRAFLVEDDKPGVTSQGPKQALICYKCQSHRVERKEAIIELVQTEINYGNDFQIIKEEFLSPMQTGGIVSPDNLAKIFLNIQELLDVSTKFCQKIQNSMEECMNKNDEELCHMNVGKVFIENVEFLQAYELYCSRQPEAMSLLESLQKKNDVLRVFLNITCHENPKCRKMDINSFLMAPVQRVTKYPLLLSRIRRATPRWHGDREDLKLAQRKVEEQIAKINSLTKSSEIKAKKFQSNLGASDSVDSSRLKKLASDVLTWTLDEMQLLMHGQLKVLCSDFSGGQSWTKRAIKRSMETHLLFCIRGQNEPIKVDSEEDDCLQFPNISEISDASLLLLKRKSNGKYTLFRVSIKLFLLAFD